MRFYPKLTVDSTKEYIICLKHFYVTRKDHDHPMERKRMLSTINCKLIPYIGGDNRDHAKGVSRPVIKHHNVPTKKLQIFK